MRFAFRELHPQVALGTATDRYAGWLGQVYTRERWAGRVTRRTHEVGGRSFVEEVLPVESVEEYFEHFGALELDFTFYRPLLDEHLRPTDTFHLVRTYAGHLREGDRLFLKAPQAVVAPRLRRAGGFVANPDYLDADFFTHRFYAPAAKLLHDRLGGILFEQESRRAAERDAVEDEAADLERFFRRIPADKRYHLELRTESYLAPPVFDVLARLGVGQALSHWTWLPPLACSSRCARWVSSSSGISASSATWRLLKPARLDRRRKALSAPRCSGRRSQSPAMGCSKRSSLLGRQYENPFDPETNALRGTSYLSRSLEAGGGSARLALAGYNGGIGVISRGEGSWPAETNRYVRFGSPMYEDARSGATTSATLEEWYRKYGASLCRQASNRLGIY